jgi:TRAP-type C4-dicarboxylate transport system substrate-binding protein
METGELRYYHSSQNNSRFFDVPHLIRTEEDLERFLDELQGQDILEFIRQQRPENEMGRPFADQCDVLCQQAV